MVLRICRSDRKKIFYNIHLADVTVDVSKEAFGHPGILPHGNFGGLDCCDGGSKNNDIKMAPKAVTSYVLKNLQTYHPHSQPHAWDF